jgi:hypothetical protein
MKRDMDLIRDLMKHIEDDPQLDGTRWTPITDPKQLGIARHSMDEVAYCLRTLIEEGLVEGEMSADAIPTIARLTWDGHEFLANIKDDTVWAKTKDHALGVVQSASLSVLVNIAQTVILRIIGQRPL